MGVTRGQYAGVIHPFMAADLLNDTRCSCGSPATKRAGDILCPKHLCDGCHFRHTVMKAAGREDEFWAARKEQENLTVGWVSYNVKFVAQPRPDTTMRLRHIAAGTDNG